MVACDIWLSEMLNRKAYTILLPEKEISEQIRPGTFARALEPYMGESPVFIFAKVAPTDFRTLGLLSDLRFRVVESTLVFEKKINQKRQPDGPFTIRFSAPEDQQQVVNLARLSFKYSRFHLDTRFSADTANEIKAAWVNNYFCGNRGDHLVVALKGETVAGFMLLLAGQDAAIHIDLIAVDERYRRKNIAGNMIAFAETHLPGTRRIYAGTQAANIASVRMYEQQGFRLSSSRYVMHYHN